MKIDESINVLGEPLDICGGNPVTGFFRDGKCNTCQEDVGSHTVCIEISQKFLAFSKFLGNDLSTPVPESNFTGLKEGGSWCLCASRWLEAMENDMAPRVYLQRTHIKALEIVSLDRLKKYAVDLN